jgi:hypothetical protein
MLTGCRGCFFIVTVGWRRGGYAKSTRGGARQRYAYSEASV